MWGEIVFSDKISVTHLPRKVNLFRHIKLAPKGYPDCLKQSSIFTVNILTGTIFSAEHLLFGALIFRYCAEISSMTFAGDS